MLTEPQVKNVIEELSTGISSLFPAEKVEAILYGSYARGEADDDSDLDVLFLVESPRDDISSKNWEIGDIASELLLNYGILVSPIVENRVFFQQNAETVPFFRNVKKEGIQIGA